MSDIMGDFLSAFARIVRLHRSKIAIINASDGKTWTYGELDALTDRIAAELDKMVPSGTGSLLLLLPNSVDAFTIFLGAAKLGIDVAPISTEASARDLENWCNLVKPAFCIHSMTTRQLAEASKVFVNMSYLEIIPNGQFNWLTSNAGTIDVRSKIPRLLLHTSGTTGEPKGLVFDVGKLWAAGAAFTSAHDFVDSSSRFLNLLPMSYLGGLFNLGIIPLTRGASVVITEAFSGKSFINFWSDLERFGINVLWLVPTIVRGLLSVEKLTKNSRSKEVAKQIRGSFLGTAPIDLATKRAFEDTFGIALLENYALSETTFLTTETLGNRHRRQENSVGKPMSYAEIRIIPITEATEDNQSNDILAGEILTKTPYFFSGYLDENGKINLPLDSEGYLHTGDLGWLNEEGMLIYSGRTRDIIKKGGYFVALREIELLALRVATAEDAAAIPITHNFYGEDYILAILAKKGANNEALVAEVRREVQSNCAKYKWPSKIVAVSEFPRTQSGKIRKKVLAEQLS